MSGKRTPTAPTTAIKVHPDGSVTFPPADIAIIQSALLWARLDAEGLAKTCARLSTDETFTPDQRATQAKNADYHLGRIADTNDLENRIIRAKATRPA